MAPRVLDYSEIGLLWGLGPGPWTSVSLLRLPEVFGVVISDCRLLADNPVYYVAAGHVH